MQNAKERGSAYSYSCLLGRTSAIHPTNANAATLRFHFFQWRRHEIVLPPAQPQPMPLGDSSAPLVFGFVGLRLCRRPRT
jgi:hypothetical protein